MPKQLKLEPMKPIPILYNLFVILTLTSGCNFIEVPPPSTQLVGSTVYSENASAAAAITGIFQTMTVNSIGGGQTGISAILGLSSDELGLYPVQDALLNQAYSNSLNSRDIPSFWIDFYNIIYQANLAIQELSKPSALSPNLKSQFIGEAKFVRAFSYFYLSNIFGHIPLVLSTDYKVNSHVSQSDSATVYSQILRDLIDASTLLGNDYLSPTGTTVESRVRPNAFTCYALMSRIYLYQQKWDSADMYASKIITDNRFQLESDLNATFTFNSKETIWELEPPNSGFNAPDAVFMFAYLYGGPQSYAPFILPNPLIDEFEPGDKRKITWVASITVDTTTYSFPYKYKLGYTGQPPTEYQVVFRLAEQLLIRAEARARLNNIDGALSDLNVIRSRAGINLLSDLPNIDLLKAITKERKLELFTEYGHRWLDLKRLGLVNDTMSHVTNDKGGSWETTDALFPIPQSEILSNNKLNQNPGYD